MHFFSDCHSSSAWCAKIIKIAFSTKTDFLFTKPDLRPRQVKRGMSKCEKWEDFNEEAAFTDAEGNTASVF